MDLQDLRDLVIVVYALAATGAMIFATLVVALVGRALARALRRGDRLVQRRLLPALGTARRNATTTQRGMARLAQWVAEPVMHAQAALAGARRGLAVALGLEQRR